MPLGAVAWVLAYLTLVSLPLLVLLASDVPQGLGFWWDFSLGLGFAGLGVMALQFALTARFRSASAPFGIDIVYYFHRWVAVGGLVLLVGHWAVLRVSAPAALGPVLPHEAAGYMTAGRIALLLFLFLVVTSLWRVPLRLEYDRWRIAHGALAVVATGLAGWHVIGAGYYTATPASRWLLGVYTGLLAALLVWVRVGRPWRLLREPWRVTGVRPETGRSWTLTLEPEGHGGIRFRPGQFVWLFLGRSPFRAREHPFSIASSACDTAKLEFTIKELGDFTATIGRTPIGTPAWVDGPHGVFTVDRHLDAPAFAFVAGGVGIAPIISMLRTLADRADGRPVRLLYANERLEDVLFRDELRALEARLNLETTHVIRSPPDSWTGERGLPTPEIVGRWLPSSPADAEYFLCGPAAMSAVADRALRRAGVPMTRIHWELFEMA